jgi:hypothetical protein
VEILLLSEHVRPFTWDGGDVGSTSILALNMNPFNVITYKNPLRIKLIPTPAVNAFQGEGSGSFSFLKIRAQRDDNSDHYRDITGMMRFDNKTRELVMTEEGLRYAMRREKNIVGEVDGTYIGENGKGYLFDEAFYTLIGKCNIKNPPDLMVKFPQLSAGDIITSICQTHINSRLAIHTRRTELKPDWTFSFDDIPLGSECSVKAVFLDERGDIGLPSEYICPEEKGDVYTFNRGDGRYTIQDEDGDNDTLVFGKGIKKDDLFTAFEGNNNIIVGIKEGGKKSLDNPDLITIENFRSSVYGDFLSYGMIENFVFEDGTRLGLDGIISLLGTDGNDRIIWRTVLNINTGDGDDLVVAPSGGDNILEGGRGNDELYGMNGNDTYIFNIGDGKDIIGVSGSDRILFGKGITSDDIIIRMDGEFLVIALNEDGKEFEELSDTIKSRTYKYLTLEFSDGTTINVTEELEKQKGYE